MTNNLVVGRPMRLKKGAKKSGNRTWLTWWEQGSVYEAIIQAVVTQSATDFEESGVSSGTLNELQQVCGHIPLPVPSVAMRCAHDTTRRDSERTVDDQKETQRQERVHRIYTLAPLPA